MSSGSTMISGLYSAVFSIWSMMVFAASWPMRAEALAHRSQLRFEDHRQRYVVEPNDGDILGHVQPGLLERLNRSDRRDVVVREQRGEVLFPEQAAFSLRDIPAPVWQDRSRSAPSARDVFAVQAP